MIGQEKARELVTKGLPRFLIITGPKGMGKKTVARYLAAHNNGYVIEAENNSVDTVRELITQSYKTPATTTYVFTDCDNMSLQAKNALLKVTEEPPMNSYFIMTVCDINNTLATIKSRGVELQLSPYTRDELMKFMKEGCNEEILEVSSTPLQVRTLCEMDFDEFYGFCEKVIDNLGEVTRSNALKITDKMKFKEEDEGYDPILFLNCIAYILTKRIFSKGYISTDTVYAYTQIQENSAKAKREFNVTGIKKKCVFDMWLLDAKKLLEECK